MYLLALFPLEAIYVMDEVWRTHPHSKSSLSPLCHSPLVFSHRCVVLLLSLLHGGTWTGQQVLSRQTQELEDTGHMQLFIFDRKRLAVDYYVT